jgi:hypothetical protein
MRILFCLLSFTLTVSSLAQSRTIAKAKEDFTQGQFVEGLQRLNSLSKDPNEQTLFNYFKAYYFYLPNNPNYALDSAYNCVVRSAQIYSGLSEKDRSGLCAEFLICQARFGSLQDSLTNEIFTDLVRKKDLKGLQNFCLSYPQSKAYSAAVQKVEELKFEQAKTANDLTLLDQFLKDYPQSKYSPQVNSLREKIRYELAIKVNALSAYQLFLTDFINSTYQQDVLNRIEDLTYTNAKAAHSLAIYKDFQTQFPKSKYKVEIDSLVYGLRYDAVMLQPDIVAIEALLAAFPKGPKTTDLQQLLDDKYFALAKAEPTLTNLENYCTKYKGNGARFTELAQLLEKMRFDQAQQFNSKESWLKFMADFPNSNLLSEAKIALADLFTIAPYLNANGRMEFRDLQTKTKQFNKEFDFILPFENGKAIVQENGRFGLLDDQGKYLITPLYDKMEAYFSSNLIVASKLKPELVNFWQKTTDEIYNDNWSQNDILALKSQLSTITSYNAETPAEISAFRRYLGALVSENYYSYDDFSYDGTEDEEFYKLKEKADKEFNQMDFTLYLFAPGPFTTKKVTAYSVSDMPGYLYSAQYFNYSLDNINYMVEYVNGSFVDCGTDDHLTMFFNSEVKVVRDGFFEAEEGYNPGSFYLTSLNGTRLTKQEYNVMEPIGTTGAYFLCHQGGTYEQFKGVMWDIIGGKWGVINKAGQIILPMIFDQLYAVDSFDLYPYLVATINKVLPTEYNNYNETLGNVGLVNLEGKELIPYSDGYNIIEFKNPQTIIVTKNAVVGYYANGMTDGAVTLGGTAGVIDLQRKTILPVEYNEIMPINNCNQFVVRKGMKLVASKEFTDEYTPVGGKYSLVNRNNQFLIPTPIDFLNTDLVGCVGCAVGYYDQAFNGKWGVINELGKTVVPFTYSDILASQLKGVLTVNTGALYKKEAYGYEVATNGKYGLMRNNALMTPIKYKEIYIYEGYIEAQLGESTELFQPNCQPLPFACDALGNIGGQENIKTSLLAYRVGAKWGLVNANFEKITEPIFWGEIDGPNNQHPFTFEKGYFLVDQGGMKCYVTRKGQVLKDGLN